jgi:hypothetical protein
MKFIHAEFFALKGKVITAVVGLELESDSVTLYCSDSIYMLSHSQDCCEEVKVVKIQGRIDDILKSEILLAETDSDAPTGFVHKYEPESHTWTSFRIVAKNGNELKFWWLGVSNGYYSEEVSVALITK